MLIVKVAVLVPVGQVDNLMQVPATRSPRAGCRRRSSHFRLASSCWRKSRLPQGFPRIPPWAWPNWFVRLWLELSAIECSEATRGHLDQAMARSAYSNCRRELSLSQHLILGREVQLGGTELSTRGQRICLRLSLRARAARVNREVLNNYHYSGTDSTAYLQVTSALPTLAMVRTCPGLVEPTAVFGNVNCALPPSR